MDKQFVFQDFVDEFAVPFTVTLQAAGAYGDNGKFVAGAETTDNRVGIFLPLSQDDLQFVPNGTYTEQDRKLYVTAPLPMGASLVKGTPEEIAAGGGQRYKVESVKDYSDYADVTIYYVKGVGA